MRGVAVSLLITLLVFFSPAVALSDSWGSWKKGNHHAPPKGEDSIFEVPIRFFQKHLSPIDGARCSMYPTCSAYARQAVREHGPFLGSIIFVDRLIHEGDAIERQDTIIKHGYVRFHDPLADNTFWLKEPN